MPVIEAVSGHQREAKGEKPDEPVMHHREGGSEVCTGAFVTVASQPCEERGEKHKRLPWGEGSGVQWGRCREVGGLPGKT